MNPHAQHFWNREKSKCNICGNQPWFWLPRGHSHAVLSKWEVIGAGRRYVDCLFCGASDRDRLVYWGLQHIIKPENGANILHVAPEKPIWKRWNRSAFQVLGLDKRTQGYAWSYGKEVINGDMVMLPFDDKQFDLVVANHVLEHIPNEREAIIQLHRVLKPNGRAIIQVPFSPKLDEQIELPLDSTPKEKIEQLGQFDHVRLYGKDPWLHWQQMGFKAMAVKPELECTKSFRINPLEPLIILEKQKEHDNIN